VDLRRGFDYATRAVSLAEKSKYSKGLALALTLKGYYFFVTGEYREACKLYNEATRVPKIPRDVLGYNYVMTANVLRALASYDSARTYYTNAIELLANVGDRKQLAFAYRNIGRLSVLQWKNDEAKGYFQKALSIYEEIGSNYGKAEVYFALAGLQENLAAYTEAQDYIGKGCSIAERLDDNFLRLHCLINQGDIQYRLGQFLPALETLLKAAELLKTSDVPHTLSTVYLHLGNVYERLGQNDVALRYFLEALKIAEQLGMRYEIAELQSHIAWIYKNQHNFDSAFEAIEKSLKIRESIGDRFGVANAYNVLGIIYMQQRNYDKGLEWLNKSLAIRKAIGFKEGVAACLYNMALVYEEKKQFSKALEHQAKALALEKEIGNRFNIGIGYNGVGSVYTYLKKYDSAAQYLTVAEQIGKETGSIELKMENCFYWSEFYENQGKAKEALYWHKRYAALNDSVYFENSATKLAEMQALYQAEQKDREITLLNQEKLLQRNQIQLQEARINLQSYVIVFAIIGFVLVSLLAYKTYRYNKEMRFANYEIVHQKEEIQNQAEELRKAYGIIAESHRVLERKVEERTSALREAYKELDTFFYRASHDFRRPLTTFLGLVEVANITVQEPEARELFNKVKETAVNLDRMLLKLQSISDVGSEELYYGEVSLPSLFRDVLSQFAGEIEERNIRIETQTELTTGFYSYPAMVRMVIENLVENSINFCRYKNAFISLRALKSGNNVIVEVVDNGDGIDPKYQDRIFDMYYRANDRSKGNGLGLYLIKKACEKLKCRILFSSHPDDGTYFRLLFPLELAVS
jgi:signal transduction histidine kinase/tetratricopeptide (TPR) repeat protein